MIISIFFLSLIGCAISLYAFFIEKKLRANPRYKPMCDLSDLVSCSRPILSKYNSIVGFSNALVGIIYYAFTTLLSLFDQATILLYCSSASLGVSAVLAYILYVRVKSFCLICNALYLINIVMFLLLFF